MVLSVVTCIILAIVGTICGGAGFYLGFSPQIQDYINEEVVKKTRLTEGTEQYERWEELPFPLKFRIFVFNVTNSEDVVKYGAKPMVHEVGPFVYHEYFYKENIHYAKRDDTFRYNQYVHMEFVREESVYGENQNITVLNLPLQGVFQNEEEGLLPPEVEIVGMNYIWPKAFGGDGMFVTLTIKDFFFKGYAFCKKPINENQDVSKEERDRIDLLKIFCKQVKIVAGGNPTLVVEEEKIRFSMFNHKHNHTDGLIQVSAGRKNIEMLGQIKTWNEDKYLEIWDEQYSHCNKMRGTDSTIYPPFNNMSSIFYTYITDICRGVVLRSVEETQFKGINGIRATMGAENLKNDGNNSCYCIRKTRDLDGELNCLPEGFCDMSNCLKAPIIISYPHMLWADKRYRSTVDGLSPNEYKHTSYLEIEPTTGTPLQGRKRIQFNMIIRPIGKIKVTENVTPAVVPILWVEESFDLPDDMADKLKVEFFDKMAMLDTATFVLIGTGVTCYTAASILIMFPRF